MHATVHATIRPGFPGTLLLPASFIARLEIAQVVPEPLQGVSHPALNGVDGRPHHLSDLLEAEALNLTQQEYFLLLIGEALHGLDDATLQEARAGQSFRRGTRVGNPARERLVTLIERGVTPQRHPTSMIDATIACDGIEPRREPRVTSEIPTTLDDPEPYVLVGLLGPAAIAYASEQEIEKRSAVSLEQRLERSRVAVAIRQEQRFVRESVHGEPGSTLPESPVRSRFQALFQCFQGLLGALFRARVLGSPFEPRPGLRRRAKGLVAQARFELLLW